MTDRVVCVGPILFGMIPERLQWLVRADAPASELAEIFSAAGHELYLVGGSLRDALCGKPPSDLDFATAARPEQIRRAVEDWADSVFGVGEQFGTVGVRKGDLTHEITTFRAEIYRDDSRKPQVTFADDIETDLSRRDFTVNAMALRLPDAQLVDPFGGLTDVARSLLRTPLSPEISFSDDPLRMLRLFRFISTIAFVPDEATLSAVSGMADRLEIVSAERIRDEFSKLMVGAQVADALWGLVHSGLADYFIPELPLLRMEQDPVQRHKDVLAHTVAVVEKTDPRPVLRLAALLHDVGKPATREIGPRGVTFHHHEVVGARIARDRLRALRYEGKVVDDVSKLVFLHLRPHTFKMGWTDSAVRRYVRDAGPLLDDLNQLVRCDVTTANPNRASKIQRGIDELESSIADLRLREELAAIRPPIDGHAVMKRLGLSPGRVVGEIMDMLLEHRLDHGPYSEDEAFELVDRWAVDKGTSPS
jgi:poly(A) polymerase